MNFQTNTPLKPEQVQEQLGSILADALKLNASEIDIQMPFLEMGASSLVLVDVFRIVAETFGVRPSMRKVFNDYINIQLLSGYIIELVETQKTRLAEDSKSNSQPQSVEISPELIEIPLTEMQKQIGFLSRYSENAKSAYNETVILKLSGTLDYKTLQEAFELVINRHEALRITLSIDEEVQRIWPTVNLELPLRDFSHEASNELNSILQEELKKETKTAFDFEKSLFRAKIIKLHPILHILIVTGHSLILDQRSLHLILSEIGSLYRDKLNGMHTQLEEPISFQNYIKLLKKQQERPEFQEAEAYWLQQYSEGIPNLDLPFERIRPPVKSYAGSRLVIPLDADLISCLKSWNSQHGSTLFMTLFSIFNVLLYRLTQQNDFVVGIFSQGNLPQATMKKLVANTSNPLPLRTKISGSQSFQDYVTALHSVLLNIYDHQDYPFASLIQKLSPERDQSRSAMFTVSLDIDSHSTVPEFGDLQVERITPPICYTRYDLSLTIVETEDNLQLQCDYASDLLDSTTVKRWMVYFKNLIKGLSEHSGEPIHKLPLLSVQEQILLREKWNQTDKTYPQELTIHQLFEQQCQKTPSQTAVVCGNNRWTYQQLNERANQIARYLQTLQVSAQTRVGICLKRSGDIIASILGIFKVGATYVPLDPAYPKERLRFMLDDADVLVLITQATLVNQLPTDERRQVFCLDTEKNKINEQKKHNLRHKLPVDNLAYILYTSGSTGKPKGVAVEHLSVVNLLFWTMETFDEQDSRGVLFSTSVCFDVSIFEMFFPISCGGQVIVAENVLHLPSLPAATEVTLINTVPSAISDLLQQKALPESLRTVNLAGEALFNSLAQAVYEQSNVRKVYNFYGPTESTVYSTFTLVEKGTKEQMTIGYPIANTKTYIADQYHQLVPFGVTGELLLSGVGLARGYLNNPQATAEKFIPNFFTIDSHSRLYKTGDLVRRLKDGRIVYLGRKDYQVKLRGFRIELGEIENTLLQHSEVQETVVVAKETESGHKKLVAYLVTPQKYSLTREELQIYLKQKLPKYMIPASFVFLEQIPRTVNGKLDRKALTVADTANQIPIDKNRVWPQTPTEDTLTNIWAEILETESIGIYDDFFALGGHSLLITQLALKIKQMFQVKFSLQEFFAEPTVAGLATKIDKLREKSLLEVTKTNTQIDAQTGLAVQKRYEFLEQEAFIEPAINGGGLIYQSKAVPEKIFITGATGFVSVHVLQQFLQQSLADIYCLVRCSEPEEGKLRILKSLKKFHLWEEGYEQRIFPVKGDLSQEDLGIEPKEFEFLAQNVDLIFHSGAAVNFIYPYQALKSVNVDGTKEIIKLAFKRKIKPVHFVSTIAVWPMGAHQVFTNDSSIDHKIRLNMAYDETKWVSEKMLFQARNRGLPVVIYRPGEVSGHSKTGVCIPEYFIWSILAGSIQLQAIPLVNCFIDLTPVDYAAQSMAYLSLQSKSLNKAFHITNPSPIHSTHIYSWLRNLGYCFDILPLVPWRNKLFNSSNLAENALYPYVAVLEEFQEINLNFPRFDCTKTVEALEGSSIYCPEVNKKLFSTYIDFLIDVGFLPEPKILV